MLDFCTITHSLPLYTTWVRGMVHQQIMDPYSWRCFLDFIILLPSRSKSPLSASAFILAPLTLSWGRLARPDNLWPPSRKQPGTWHNSSTTTTTTTATTQHFHFRSLHRKGKLLILRFSRKITSTVFGPHLKQTLFNIRDQGVDLSQDHSLEFLRKDGLELCVARA